MSAISYGPEMLFSMVCYLAYAWCSSCFFVRHLGGSLAEKRVFGGLLFLSYGGMALFLKNSHIFYLLYALCNHMILMVLVMTVFRGEWEKKLLAAVLLMAMTVLIWNFSESFLCCTALFIGHIVTGGQKPAVLGAGAERFILPATYAIGIGMVTCLSKLLVPVFCGKRKSWYLCLALPLAGVVLVTDLINWAASNGIMVQDWGKYGLYENQLFSHGAMCIFTGLAMAASGFFVFGMDRIHREERTGEEYRSKVMYYQMMEEQYGQMERLRHDMKNHLIALSTLVQNRQWEQTRNYLSQMAEAGNVESGDEVTGSLVIDALLYHKRRQAMDAGIAWQCNVRVPKDSGIKEMDLCILAGNILDNAIEACCRIQNKNELFIHIFAGTVKKCFLLEVQNSTDLEDCKEIVRSKKGDFAGHGLGLSNVRAAVSRYNGTVHMEAQKKVFTISVLLPLAKSAVYNIKESL